jgi:hypothetical protein
MLKLLNASSELSKLADRARASALRAGHLRCPRRASHRPEASSPGPTSASLRAESRDRTGGQTRSELGLTEANRGALAQVRAHAQRERPRHMARIASGLAGARVEADAEVLASAASGEGVLRLNFPRPPARRPPVGRPGASRSGLYRILPIADYPYDECADDADGSTPSWSWLSTTPSPNRRPHSRRGITTGRRSPRDDLAAR